MLLLLGFVLSCFISAQSDTVYVTPCKQTDKACMISSAEEVIKRMVPGIPEFDMPSIDPLYVESVRNDGVNLKLGFRNMNIYGVGKCKVKDLVRNFGNNTIRIDVECPLKAVGQYDLKGKMLFLEAFGDGDFEIKTKKVIISVTLKTKITKGADGKEHWKATGFDYSYDLVEKVDIDIKNLFNGDETRAKPIREVFNHSWKELVSEVGGPIIKELMNKAVAICNKFFAHQSTDKLEIP
ncbi:circadian clock-controlled protein daywake-like [Leptidea sinapis]|uniref:circadian clock-controlled protein daywake-like n=1 Tax=Leptidea sinapis TaxID=189913 RepID=UPI0021268D22|nr:circadian clock-controlled protein daywake-like [Leptidea sinapis]